MKRLFKLGLVALMMLFAMPAMVWAQEEGGSETGGEEQPSKLTLMLMDFNSGDELNTESANEVARYMSIAVVALDGQTPGGSELAEGNEEEAVDGIEIYYTFDADVTLSRAAYQSQGDDKKIFMPAIMEGYNFILTNTDADNVTLKVIAYMVQDGAVVDAMTSDIASYQLTFTNVTAPAFSETTGSELEIGTVVKITNVPVDGYAVYSTDGTLPTFMNQGEGSFEYNDGIELQGEVGATVTIKAINYVDDDDVVAGSKMTTATYTLKAASPAPATYEFSLTAVGATETTDGEGNTVQQFSAPEPQFTVTAPADAPEGWYATVVAYTFEAGLVAVEGETDTLRADNPTKTFSTLMEGTEYLCLATVRGADHTQLWANYNSNGSGGVYFKTAGTAPVQDPTLAVKKAGTFTMNADTIVFDGPATFDMFVVMPEGENMADYSVVAEISDPEGYINWTSEPFTEFSYDAADSVRGEFPLYNGEYAVRFYLNDNTAMQGGEVEGDLIEFFFNVTNNPEPAEPAEPELAVKAVNNTMAHDTVVFADGNAAFDMFVTGLTAGDTTYRIDVRVFAGEGDFPMPDMFAAADSLRFENTYFNGVYEANFALMHKTLRGDVNVKDTTIIFRVTGGEVRPEITVKAVNNTMAHDTVVFADGNAAFDMFVEGVAAADTTYALYVTVWNMADEDVFPAPDVLKFADSVRFENTYYNGVYEATFELRRLNRRGEYINVTEQKVVFAVTEGEARPELTVKPVGNTMAHDTVVFADGNAAFDMFVTGITFTADDDSTFKFHVTVYTEDENDFRLPQEFTAADSVRFADVYYNGVYEAVFELMRRSPRGTYTNVTEQKIVFMVTENEEPVENYELTAVPVGAGENNTFSTAEVAFDITVTGMTEADSNLLVYAKVYTKAQYENFDSVGIVSLKAAASVRFNDTLENGEYVAEFQLMRATEWGDFATNSEPVTINFSVSAETANESAELAGVNVYPNPNAGAFNVAVPERARVEIFGLNGAMLMSREVNAGVAAFNLDHSGIYFVRVMAGNKTAVKRVIVR